MSKCKVHKYERMQVGLKNKIVYKCVECPTVLNVPEMMIGRESKCWGVCGGIVKYSREDFMQELKFPICESCRQLRKEQKQLLSKIG